MQEISISKVFEEIDTAFKENDIDRVETLLWPALNQFSDMPQLWFYAGNLLFKQEKLALATAAFHRANELAGNSLVLSNLGATYRRLNQHDEGLAVLKSALDLAPDFTPALVNLGSMYVNEGSPNEGIPHLEKAVAQGLASGKMEGGATWNLALLYLEAARWAEGFDLYRAGVGSERQLRNYISKAERGAGLEEPPHLKADSPPAQGRKTRLIVHGEQGIGDELMVAQLLEQACDDYDIWFECHPRLEWLMRNSSFGHKLKGIYPTRKDSHIDWTIKEGIRADYKAPLFDLAAIYRRSTADFANASVAPYQAPQEEAAEYAQRLKHFAAGRPIVGLATRGGVMQTARTYRTLKLPEADALFKNTECVYVGLDYDDMSMFVSWTDQNFPNRYVWFPSIVQHFDYEHRAALTMACDMVVTVCQSQAHLSAGLGQLTRVLTPYRCAWRYAKMEDPDQWLWWRGAHARLYREETPGDWSVPIARVVEDIRRLS